MISSTLLSTLSFYLDLKGLTTELALAQIDILLDLSSGMELNSYFKPLFSISSLLSTADICL